VRITRPEILALERLADRDGKSVDAVLVRELLDVVSANSEYLATAMPGLLHHCASMAEVRRRRIQNKGPGLRY